MTILLRDTSEEWFSADRKAHYTRTGYHLSCSGHDPNFDLVTLQFCFDIYAERVREGLKRNDFVEVAAALRDVWTTSEGMVTVGKYTSFIPVRDDALRALSRLRSFAARVLLRRMLTGKISPAESEECLRVLSGQITVEDVDAEIASIEAGRDFEYAR